MNDTVRNRSSSPATRAPESRRRWLQQTLRFGGPGQVVFAINNACNANCGFCGFALEALPRSQWRFVSTLGAKEALDVLQGLFIRYAIITGGEPLLHPDVDEIVDHAQAIGMTPILVTNGSRLNEARCRELVASGVSSVVISIDAEDADTHESNRRLNGVCEKIRAANATLHAAGVQTTASVTVSRLLKDYDALVRFLRRLAFGCVTFSYPLTRLDSSFLGHAESPLVDFSPSELDEHFERIKTLKTSFPVANPRAGLEEMQRFVRGEPQRFECLGGSRYFYLDWDLMVWRCHYWNQPMCSVFELDESRFIRDGCMSCMIDCFRDSSVMQHVGISMKDAADHARAGRFFRAFSALWRSSNLTSVAAALETRQWINGL